MNWDRIEGNWKEIKGKAKQQWGKLTDDDLDVVEGRREEFEGLLQSRYGYAKDKAQDRNRRLDRTDVNGCHGSAIRNGETVALAVWLICGAI